MRVKALAEDGNEKAKRLIKYNDKFDKILSTLLIGNNIVNILASTLATIVFIDWIGTGNGPTVSTIVMTVVVLIFG